MDYSYFGYKKRRRQLNSQTVRVRNKISLLVLRIALAGILIGGFFVAATGLGLLLGIWQAAPELDVSNISPGVYSSVIVCSETGEELHRLHGGENRTFIPLSQIASAPHVYLAFVAIEDERFFQHNGVDIRSIGRAFHRALTTDGDTEGASTITQQLIKNTFGIFNSDLVWKLQEQYLAVTMERELIEAFGGNREEAKMYILEMYVNTINLGRQNYGIQAAALFYYGVDAWDLTIAQAATIAAITKNPSYFPPDMNPEGNWGRAIEVLRTMRRVGFITDEEFDEAVESDVYATLVRDDSTMAVTSTMSCYHDALLAQVRNDLMELNGWTAVQAYREIYTGGYRIYSLQNMAMQAIVDEHYLDGSNFPQQDYRIVVEFRITVRDTIANANTNFSFTHTARSMEEVEEFKEQMRESVASLDFEEIVNERTLLTEQPQSAFVIIDHHTGHVLAIRGIRGEKQISRAFCRATQATRQPGSQFKPLASFLPAFDLGIMTPSSVINDIPLIIQDQYGIQPDHNVPNWYRNPPYEGISTARRAIYHSGNVASVRTMMDFVGIPTMWEYLHRLGFTTLVNADRNNVVPIGGLTHGVHLIELTAAYAAIANGGLYNRPVLYSRVVDRNGNIVLENHHEPRRIMRDTTAFLLTSAMRDTVTIGTGTAANWANNAQMRRDIPIAGKTGTTDLSRDLGFSGYTPYLTAGIWLGNDNNQGMSTVTRNNMPHASLFHLPLWRNIMQAIHEDFEPRDFARPAGIVAHAVCLDSGHLPSEFCGMDPRGNRVRSDLFSPGTVPAEVCIVHQMFNVCGDHREFLAGPHCANPVSRVGLVRPVPIPEEFDNVVIGDRQYEHPATVLMGIICDVCQEEVYTPPPVIDDSTWMSWEDWYNSLFPSNNPQTQTPADDDDDDIPPVYDVPPPADDNDNGDDSVPPSGLWGNW